MNIADALNKKFEGIDDRDGFPFGEDCSGITIRMHVSPLGRLFTDAELIFASSSLGILPAHMLNSNSGSWRGLGKAAGSRG